MNRKTFGIDRALTLLLGLVLVLGGVWVLLWALDALPSGWWSPSRFRVGVPEGYSDNLWWPWAIGVLGLLLTALGTAWFVGHFRSNRVSTLSLPGDAEGGRLLLSGGALGGGLAAALVETCEGVTGASGRVLEQGRHLVLDVTATVRPEGDLREVVRSCDVVAAHALHSTGREDLTCRVRLKVASRAREAPRVH
ncbi:MAG TPA: hypothetical protein VFD41_03525 [Actinomycetales bacterium]|nr:hypothetical protein [Actinomycetales bacterium]